MVIDHNAKWGHFIEVYNYITNMAGFSLCNVAHPLVEVMVMMDVAILHVQHPYHK